MPQQIVDTIKRNAKSISVIAPLIAVALVVLTSFYSVGPGEQGVVRTFGRESGKTGPGLHVAIPLVQSVDVVNIERVQRVEVGFRGTEPMPHEALMLTGDENIVDAQMIVQYRITDPSKFLFRLRDPETALRASAEVALRGMVGRTTIDDAMTTGREIVQAETQAWLQKLMDTYDSGLTITEVKLQVVDAPTQVRESFHDVVRAREQKEQKINEAKGYQADLIPSARGQAREIVRGAEAYKEERVLRARGDAAKFEAVLAEYLKAPDVTRERLYLETMERLFHVATRKTLIDGDVTKHALPLLPLGQVGLADTLQGGAK